jgi:hypothetical protein
LENRGTGEYLTMFPIIICPCIWPHAEVTLKNKAFGSSEVSHSNSSKASVSSTRERSRSFGMIPFVFHWKMYRPCGFLGLGGGLGNQAIREEFRGLTPKSLLFFPGCLLHWHVSIYCSRVL